MLRASGTCWELGTILLSVLAGHWRYAHMNSIRNDGVNPAVRRGLIAMDEVKSEEWLKGSLKASYAPLLREPWVLDVDTTVKQLYGHQEDAKAGYNPT